MRTLKSLLAEQYNTAQQLTIDDVIKLKSYKYVMGLKNKYRFIKSIKSDDQSDNPLVLRIEVKFGNESQFLNTRQDFEKFYDQLDHVEQIEYVLYTSIGMPFSFNDKDISSVDDLHKELKDKTYKYKWDFDMLVFLVAK